MLRRLTNVYCCKPLLWLDKKTSGGALAAAELKRKRFGIAPILHQIGIERSRLCEIGQQFLAEKLDLEAKNVGAEGYAFPPVCAIVIDDALGCDGGVFRRHALHGKAEAHDALFVIPAAEQHLIVRHFLAVDLAGIPVEADFRGPVLAAGIGAT